MDSAAMCQNAFQPPEPAPAMPAMHSAEMMAIDTVTVHARHRNAGCQETASANPPDDSHIPQVMRIVAVNTRPMAQEMTLLCLSVSSRRLRGVAWKRFRLAVFAGLSAASVLVPPWPFATASDPDPTVPGRLATRSESYIRLGRGTEPCSSSAGSAYSHVLSIATALSGFPVAASIVSRSGRHSGLVLD